MKKLWNILCLAVICLAMIACSSGPEKALGEEVKAMQQGSMYGGAPQDPGQKAMLSIMQASTYKILETKEEGDTATLTLEVHAIDTKLYMLDMMQETMQAILSGDSDFNYAKELIKKKDTKYRDITLDVELKKVNGDWKVEGGKNQLLFALMGTDSYLF